MEGLRFLRLGSLHRVARGVCGVAFARVLVLVLVLAANGGMGGIIPCETVFDPGIDFRGEELPELADLMGGHAFPGDPLVDRIRIHPKMRRNLVHR